MATSPSLDDPAFNECSDDAGMYSPSFSEGRFSLLLTNLQEKYLSSSGSTRGSLK